VDTPSVSDHGGKVLPLPNTLIGAQDIKEKKTRPTCKVKTSPISKTTLLANGKAIESSKAPLKDEDKSTDPKSVPKSCKKETYAIAKQIQSSEDKETASAGLKEEGELTDSKPVRTSHKRKIHTVKKHAKASLDKETSAADGGRDEAESTKALLPTASTGRTRRVNSKRSPRRVLSETKERYTRYEFSPASAINITPTPLETPKQPGEGDSRMRREKETVKLQYQYGDERAAYKKPLKTSKAIRPSVARNHPSFSKTWKTEGLNSHLMAILRRQKLGPEEKRRLMSQLRHSLMSGSTKTPDRWTQGLIDSGLSERHKTAKAFKTTKKHGSAGSQEQLTEKPGMTAYEIKTIDAMDLDLVPIEKPQPPVPNLAYGLERVLFNPGVYHLRDPRSRVFNFDPYLESIMPVADFDFNALKEYITSSRDETLLSAAAAENKKYTGSTSSMTSALAHFHFLLSQWRPINISNLSQGFPHTLRTFTQLQRAPSAIFLRWRNGTYAIDADKEFDTANILMMLGKSMEKLLTLPTQDFEKYRKENSDQITEDERNEAESFHYTTMGDFLMRSQLDAHDPRIPGTGMFDLKTRAVVSIRMDAQNYHNGLGYEIRSRHGEFESYEREYYDMIRAAFLKYSLQVRMGRMDGIFVAFHNTERIFGFQYISLPEMDLALHGKEDLTIGDSEFKLSLELLNRVLDRATAKFPEQSLRIFFETRDTVTPFMYIFAEPVTEDDIQRIQDSKKAEIEDYERTVLGIQREATPEEIKHEQEEAEWEELQAKVEDSMDNDELEPLDESESPDGISEDTAVIDSDIPNRFSIDEKGLISAAQPSDEHLSMLDSEVEHTNEGGAGFGGDFEKQFQHDASDAADNEELRDISFSSVEGEEDRVTSDNLPLVENHLTEGPRMDAPALRQETGGIHEGADGAVTDLKADRNSVAEAANVDDADHESKDEGNSTKSNQDLLAMTLTIRNKVNGVYVMRPEDIGSNDRWSVEYALAEVPTLEQSRTLYQKTQRRRALILRSDKKDATSKFHQSYTRKLAALSSQGRKWREEQNDIDREKPVRVLGDQIEGTQ
jgi:Mitochondrial protein Pet127